MLLSDVFDRRSIKLNLESTNKEDAFRELVGAIAAVHGGFDRDTMFRAIREREAKMNTAIAEGVAIPHGYYPGAGGVSGALGISAGGIDYDAPDRRPVYCIFLLVLGETEREKHLHVLNRVMSLVNSEAVAIMRNAASVEEITRIFSRIG